jgi:hypothetical protein
MLAFRSSPASPSLGESKRCLSPFVLLEDEGSTQGKNTDNLGPRNMTVSRYLLHRAYAADPSATFLSAYPLYAYRVYELMQLDDST